MNFASDNAGGVHPRIMAALAAANAGHVPAYGTDRITAAAQDRLREAFDAPEAAVHFVPTGTAANALALSLMAPGWGKVFCHQDAHIQTSEANAPEFFTGGAKLVPVAGAAGRITAEGLAEALFLHGRDAVHAGQNAALSLTNATEWGTVYDPDEVAALAGIARDHGLAVHMDGARFSNALASLDVLAALAERARTLDWCRPDFVPQPCIEIERGRHPVVEARLAESGAGSFIPNDCRLDAARRLLVITGPNMGGKSTFMRQVALTVLLAAIGSFVPASRCRLGPIDAIHTRIGAADDLANAQSTFMLEMTEAAQILHAATPHSLVLMDEIGRGTSTFDGLALASGIATHLHDRSEALTLFATQYFELTEFPAQHHAAINVHVGAAESGHDIVFLHTIQPGPANRSYGIQVARLAGMPSSVIHHARHALQALEAQQDRQQRQIDLFSAPALAEPAPDDTGPSPVEEALQALDPDGLSPREALEALYRLKALGEGSTPRP